MKSQKRKQDAESREHTEKSVRHFMPSFVSSEKCLLTYRTHGTADIGKKYMYFWQGMLKELWELWGACDKLLPDSTKNFSSAAPRWLLWQGEAESHGHPIRAFQSRGKTAEILSTSVALPLQEIAVVIRIKAGHLRIQQKKAQSGLKSWHQFGCLVLNQYVGEYSHEGKRAC